MKAVLFDLDGTLHDRPQTIRRWLGAHIQHFDLPEAYGPRFIELDDFGYRSKSEVLPQLVQELGLSHDPAELLKHYSTALEWACPMPHAHDTLRELRRLGFKLGVVTNGWVEAQAKCMEICGLTGLVDDVVISKAVNLSKPDPRIYHLALDRLGVSAAETWFVGDYSPQNDVWGPQQIGLKTAYLPTGHALGQERPEVVLTDLRGVLELDL